MTALQQFSEDIGEHDLPSPVHGLSSAATVAARGSLAVALHFRAAEFDCRDGTRVPKYAYPQLKAWCSLWGEPLRREFGPVRVLSGYRTEKHNAAVGGALASWHVYSALEMLKRPTRRGTRGVAVDVRCERGSVEDWARWARRHRTAMRALGGAARGGIGVYVRSGFIHLDTGPARDWSG